MTPRLYLWMVLEGTLTGIMAALGMNAIHDRHMALSITCFAAAGFNFGTLVANAVRAIVKDED